MKTRFLLTIAIVICASLGAVAQKPHHRQGEGPRNHTEWVKEMSRFKSDYVADMLKLDNEQKAKFVPVYEKMQNEMAGIIDQTRAMERSIREKGDKATDIELEKAAEAQAELKIRQGELEKKYFKEFKTILTPRQLFELSHAERKFTRRLMKDQRDKKRD